MFITPTLVPLLTAIKHCEFKNFTMSYGAYPHDVTNFESFHNGQVLVPIQLSAAPINNLMNFSGVVAENRAPKSVYPLFSSVTDKILTLEGKYTIAEALVIINTYANKAGNNFYGAILRRGDQLINPLHPLTALQILDNYDQVKSNKYSVVMYFYTNRQALDAEYASSSADIELVDKVIDNLLRSNSKAAIESNQVNMQTNVVPYPSMDSIEIEYYTTMNINKPIQVGSESFVVAHQFLTKGVVAPYYASSVLDLLKGQSARGMHITPLFSCNISYDKSSDTPDRTLSWTSVCTGSHPNSVRENLRVLTHANLGSPFNTSIVRPGALIFIDRCIDRVRELYTKVNLLSSYTPITKLTTTPICPVSEELYIQFCNNAELDFIDILTATMTASDAFTTLQQIKDYHNAITQSEAQSSPTADAARPLPADPEPVNDNPDTNNTAPNF